MKILTAIFISFVFLFTNAISAPSQDKDTTKKERHYKGEHKPNKPKHKMGSFGYF